MKLRYTSEEIERWRDKVHHRLPRLAVRTKRQALAFVNGVGYCFAFKSVNSELPCLWHAACGQRTPRFPEHSHEDPYVSFVWEMKNVLPSEGELYYGKVLRRRPTMISLEFLPYFYALTGRAGGEDDYLRDFIRGDLSPVAKSIMDTLMDSSPQVTKGLKLAVGKHTKGSRLAFDNAIAELQMKLYVVKVAEHYDPFTFEWSLVHKVFSKQVRKARRVSMEEARARILERYFQSQLIGSVRSISSLFGWEKKEIYQSLGTLMNKGTITSSVVVDGKDSRFYCLVG